LAQLCLNLARSSSENKNKMYIKDQTFKDEENLLEILFDFSLGTSTDIVKNIISEISSDLKTNEEYNKYYNSLKDEEDRLELHDEETRLRLAEQLMGLFESFEVNKAKLYGIKNAERKLLYEIDLY
jgi:hypothetical protein